MGLRIATNVQALAAQRHLSNNVTFQNNALERLSSGNRINRAGDDAAGLAISEKLKASIRSLKQAHRNANDGISLVQTAEGAMNEVSNILIRMRELSIQGASDTVGDAERTYINKEVTQLKDEIDRIANSTEYNSTKLLNGSVADLDFQVGMNNRPLEDRLTFTTRELNMTLENLGLGAVSTMTKEDSRTNLQSLDSAINQVNNSRSTLGALQNRLMSTINNLGIYTENLAAANSRIRDTDMAHETSELTKYNILTQSNIAMLGQANANPQAALKLL